MGVVLKLPLGHRWEGSRRPPVRADLVRTFTLLHVEWPEIEDFWSRLVGHVSECWRWVDAADDDHAVVTRSFNDGIAAVEVSGAAQTELRLGLFVREVLRTVAEHLAGHAAQTSDTTWTPLAQVDFLTWAAATRGADITVVRSWPARQHRGALAQSYFFRFLEPRVRGIAWRFVEPVMGGPPICY